MNSNRQISHTLSETERRALGSILSIFVARMLGLFMLLPVLALYAAQLPGATPVLVGMAVGAYGISQALLQIPFGWASDRYGRRPLLIIGLLIFASGSLFAAFSDSIYGVIFGRVLQGAGAISAVLTALLGDLVHEQRRTRAIAFVGIGIGGSFLLSLILGPLISAKIGVNGLFLVSTALAVLALVIVLLVLPNPPSANNSADRLSKKAWKAIANNGPLWRLNAGIFILHFILAALFVVLPFVLRDQVGVPADHQWTVFVAMLLISLPGTIVLIRTAERRDSATIATDRTQTVAVSLILITMTVLSLVLTQLNSRWTLTILVALFFSAFNFLEARLPASVSVVAGSLHRGAALGCYASCQFLGVFVGGVAAGYAIHVSGHRAALVICALMSLLWLIAQLINHKVIEVQSS